MLAESIMSRNPVTVDGDHTVLHVARLMREKDVGAVVVVDDDERPIGIITDRDIVIRAFGDGVKDPAKVPVDQVMSRPVVSAGQDTLIFDLLRLMSSRRVRRIPIVDGKRKVIGLVSIDDAMVLLTAELANVADVVGSSSRAFTEEEKGKPGEEEE